MANWRKHAEALNAVDGIGSWKRRIAMALGKTEGTGSWARRIAEGQNPTGKSWDRAADKALNEN